MSLFKRKKSRQEKIAVSAITDQDVIDQDTETKTNTTQDKKSEDILSPLADMPITEHLIELRRHLIKICVAVLIIFLGLVGYSRELRSYLPTRP